MDKVIISEKYAIDAWLSYVIAKNNNCEILEVFIYYDPQIITFRNMLDRHNIDYRNDGNSFYINQNTNNIL